jgi:glycosyltransferase involved in cell wall biosynthesis
MTLHDYWPICIKNIMVKDNGQLCQKDDFNCTGCKQVISQKDTTPLAIRNHLMKLSFDRIDQFISPTKYLAEVYIRNGFAKEKISIIRYGIDINRFKNIHNGRASNTIRFGYVGYMGEHKGIEYLIRAFSMVKHQNKTFLYLVGEGERLDYYKSLCYELKLDGRIKFINKIDNRKIHSIYENLDVLVLPSIWPENSPVSILEAMASKMPVLASNIGGISELVEDRITGLLSRPKDISALAQDMENLILHPEKIELIGSNGFNRIKEQNLQHIANLILERYKQTIDGI